MSMKQGASTGKGLAAVPGEIVNDCGRFIENGTGLTIIRVDGTKEVVLDQEEDEASTGSLHRREVTETLDRIKRNLQLMISWPP